MHFAGNKLFSLLEYDVETEAHVIDIINFIKVLEIETTIMSLFKVFEAVQNKIQVPTKLRVAGRTTNWSLDIIFKITQALVYML